MKELLLVYHADERDEARCSSHTAPLALLKLTTGDEVLRQRLQKVVSRGLKLSPASQHQQVDGGRGLRLKNDSVIGALLSHFHEQDTVPMG